MTNIQSPLDYLEPPDPALTNKIVTHLKSQGIFDQFRRECMADVDTKPAYLNLRQRVEGSVTAFLRKNPWRPDMNKNQMRDNLRKHVQSGGFLDMGVDRIVDQVVNPKIYTVFLPKVEEVVNSCVEMDQGKPKFVPPVRPDPKPETINFQNKHNLASRSKLPAPLTGPMRAALPSIENFKIPEPLQVKEVNLSSPNTEDSSIENYMVDEEDTEGTAEDDEESPPFEPNTETDRLILGVRTDSSDSNSNEDQVVTTIVDDNLEEIIDNDVVAMGNAENNDEDDSEDKDEESSSDEYVPKTPTINVEGSDGSLIELNTISEYKQYQTKFDEESFGNVVEEIVSSQWVDENCELLKEEKSSTEGEAAECSRKRKLNHGSFDDDSNSSVDKGHSSDDGKIATFDCIMTKKIKVEDDVEDEESETTSENVINESYDSNTDRSMDVPDVSVKPENNLRDKIKTNNSKELDKCNYNQHKEQCLIREQNNTNSSKSKIYERHESSKDRKDKDKIKKDSYSHKHTEKVRSRHKDKDKGDLKRSDKSDRRKESKHEHRDRSRDCDKDKKLDKHIEFESKKLHESSHSHDKDKRKVSKSTRHSHSSSKHSNKSSSDKNKAEKDHTHKDATEKHKSHVRSSEKDKHESRKKSRETCKSRDKEERRRSTDRDSNGPCGRSYFSNTSALSNRSTPSRNNTESSEAGDKTTSNSDNTVSDDIEVLPDENTIINSSFEQGISSPDLETSNESENTSNQSSLEWNNSSEDDSKTNIKKSSLQSFKQVHNVLLGSNSIIEIRESSDTVQVKEELPVKQSEALYDNINLEKVEDPSSSPEKENRKKDVNTVGSENITITIGKELKFKKPKIAANIFEVRKIMKKRRHMERKRMKFLMDNSSEGYLPPKPIELEHESKKNDNDDDFCGFEEACSNKIAHYDCLIKRLSDDLKYLNEEISHNKFITTSWIDIDPRLDDYLINVLKAKVYRKARVHLPPISEEYYRFDNDQNAYILLKLNSDTKKQNICGNDLNNCTILSHETSNMSFNNNKNCDGQMKDICEISCQSFKEHKNINLNNNMDIINFESLQHDNHHCKQLQGNPNLLVAQSVPDSEKYSKLTDPSTNESNHATDVSASKPVFSITFNQTYDEILKERQPKPSEDAEGIHKSSTPRTVVKITNDQKSEQVIVKMTNSTTLDVKVKVPRITRSAPAFNDESPKSVAQKKQIPFISRVNKPNNTLATSPQTMSQKLNGNISPDSTTNLEMAFFNVSLHGWNRGLRTSYSKVCHPKYANSMHTVSMEKSISQKLISDIIGIQHSTKIHGDVSDNSSQSGDDLSEKNYRRYGTRQQRYDSSDLYKPRPQLSTRRGRGRPLENVSQKRPAVASESDLQSKRKR